MRKAYDYIIVGGGSAGCVIAGRLSEDPAVSVLLLEAGPRDRNPAYRIPLMAGRLYRWRYNNWSFQTEPEPCLDDRRIDWPRGRVLGGSSAINGMIYARGQALDFDGWAQAGLPSWSFERVLPYFKRAEHHWGGESAWHGGSGPLPVTRMNTGHPMFETFIAAGQQAGFKRNHDFNGTDQEGFGFYDYNIERGERWNAARAYLGPARARPNLTVRAGTLVRRVLFEGRRATGVELGASERIEAGEEVILCGGAVNSPMLLLHSGVGDAETLAKLGIEVATDLKGVGENLQDHLNVSIYESARTPDLFYDFCRADRLFLGLARAALFRTGKATYFPHEGGAFLKSDPALATPDLQIHFMASGLTAMQPRPPWRGRPGTGEVYGYGGLICHLRPESRGSVTLRSADPTAPPVIRANYLSAESDRQAMRQAYKIMRGIFDQPAFAEIRGRTLVPDVAFETDAAIDAWIRRTASTIFHPVGTCRMGTDGLAVVDEALRVHGIDRLRVADASIMPRIVSANTHAATVMIGERAADLIRLGGSVAPS